MKTILLPTVVLLVAALSFAVAAPLAHSVTYDTVKVTVTANGQTSTSTLRVPDVYGTGVVTIPVSSQTLAQIQGAFGTTTFAFPGTYTGTFTENGQTVHVTISSADTFTVKYV